MANTKSAKKAVRSSARKHKVNSIIKKKYRETRKDLVETITAGKKKDLDKKVAAAMKSIDKAAKAKTIHKKTAARYKARIAKAIVKMS